MESYSLIIGVIFIILCIIPVWLFQRTQTRALRKLRRTFKQAMSKNDLSIIQSELWDNTYGIGVDDVKERLLYVRKMNESDDICVIDLTGIDKCSIQKKTHSASTGKSNYSIVDTLNLVLTYNNAEKQADVLEFYDESKKLQMNGEEILVEKWKNIINSHIQKRKT